MKIGKYDTVELFLAFLFCFVLFFSLCLFVLSGFIRAGTAVAKG